MSQLRSDQLFGLLPPPSGLRRNGAEVFQMRTAKCTECQEQRTIQRIFKGKCFNCAFKKESASKPPDSKPSSGLFQLIPPSEQIFKKKTSTARLADQIKMSQQKSNPSQIQSRSIKYQILSSQTQLRGLLVKSQQKISPSLIQSRSVNYQRLPPQRLQSSLVKSQQKFSQIVSSEAQLPRSLNKQLQNSSQSQILSRPIKYQTVPSQAQLNSSPLKSKQKSSPTQLESRSIKYQKVSSQAQLNSSLVKPQQKFRPSQIQSRSVKKQSASSQAQLYSPLIKSQQKFSPSQIQFRSIKYQNILSQAQLLLPSSIKKQQQKLNSSPNQLGTVKSGRDSAQPVRSISDFLQPKFDQLSQIKQTQSTLFNQAFQQSAKSLSPQRKSLVQQQRILSRQFQQPNIQQPAPKIQTLKGKSYQNIGKSMLISERKQLIPGKSQQGKSQPMPQIQTLPSKNYPASKQRLLPERSLSISAQRQIGNPFQSKSQSLPVNQLKLPEQQAKQTKPDLNFNSPQSKRPAALSFQNLVLEKSLNCFVQQKKNAGQKKQLKPQQRLQEGARSPSAYKSNYLPRKQPQQAESYFNRQMVYHSPPSPPSYQPSPIDKLIYSSRKELKQNYEKAYSPADQSRRQPLPRNRQKYRHWSPRQNFKWLRQGPTNYDNSGQKQSLNNYAVPKVTPAPQNLYGSIYFQRSNETQVRNDGTYQRQRYKSINRLRTGWERQGYQLPRPMAEGRDWRGLCQRQAKRPNSPPYGYIRHY